MRKPNTCGDCACKEGEYHEPGCDMERCPFCGGQLISCSCCYTQLGFDYDWNKPFSGLPKDIYENGLTPDLSDKWNTMLNEKGLIPYIQYPILCDKCGVLWPKLFSVPTTEWEYYIEPAKRRRVICWPCYSEIKRLIDEAQTT